ncbi:hypothetical protein LOTGIDRAFT_104452, partial [Lottia gigantea]
LRLAVRSKAWSASQSEWILAGQCVQTEEKERIGRFVFRKDSKSSMIGRLLIRVATSHILGIPYTDIKLGRTEKGKPILLNDLPPEFSNYNFNISHQGDYVVLAAEKQHQVGIDVMDSQSQRGTSISKFFGVMKRHLTDNEWKTVASYSKESDQMKIFYRHWCLKESIVKALGVGIGFEIGKLEFTLPTRDLSTSKISYDTTVKIEGKPDPQWSFEETMLGDHCVAVAIRNQNNNNQSKSQVIAAFILILNY